jgi:hypothetical protein
VRGGSRGVSARVETRAGSTSVGLRTTRPDIRLRGGLRSLRGRQAAALDERATAPPPVPPPYLLGLLLVGVAMVLLPLLYVSIITARAAAVLWWAVHGLALLTHGSLGSLKIRLFLYLAPLVGGGSLPVFLVKPGGRLDRARIPRGTAPGWPRPQAPVRADGGGPRHLVRAVGADDDEPSAGGVRRPSPRPRRSVPRHRRRPGAPGATCRSRRVSSRFSWRPRRRASPRTTARSVIRTDEEWRGRRRDHSLSG